MLMGPWALTTVGAATAAAPAAATFRKRRRVEVLSLVGLVMESSRLYRSLAGRHFIGRKSRGRPQALARIRYTSAALRRGRGRQPMSTPVAPARLPDWLTAQPGAPHDRSASVKSGAAACRC